MNPELAIKKIVSIKTENLLASLQKEYSISVTILSDSEIVSSCFEKNSGNSVQKGWGFRNKTKRKYITFNSFNRSYSYTDFKSKPSNLPLYHSTKAYNFEKNITEKFDNKQNLVVNNTRFPECVLKTIHLYIPEYFYCKTGKRFGKKKVDNRQWLY